jgi:ketosteroid isomerase-like protein
MKIRHLIVVAAVAVPLVLQPAAFGQAAPAGASASARSKHSAAAAASSFEPLDNWKAAVLAGDKTALMRLYTTEPAARAKTPQGETLDPSEEPTFWASLKSAGLDRLNIQVLEIKTLQPGVMGLTLRMEAGLKSGAAEKAVIIGASQVWLQKLGEWKIVMTQRSDPGEKQARRLPEPARPNTQLYPPPEEAKTEIASALAAATKDHKRVILVFGGNWCYDCHVLDATFRSKEFAPMVNANYHIVHVNVGNYDANLDLAEKYQIPLKKGVPSLAILAPDGSLVVSQKSGEFESTLKIGPEDVVDFLKKWKPQRGS